LSAIVYLRAVDRLMTMVMHNALQHVKRKTHNTTIFLCDWRNSRGFRA
jgi:hypothetical protein